MKKQLTNVSRRILLASAAAHLVIALAITPAMAYTPSTHASVAAVAAKAPGGGSMSLGALLALIGGILVKSIESTMSQLADAAQQLDGATQSGGPTA